MDRAELSLALRVVRRTAQLVRRVQRELITPALSKSDRSPVTVADFAAQAVASRMLELAAPETPLVGEEEAQSLMSPDAADALAQVVRFVREAEPEADAEAVRRWIDRGRAAPGKRFWTLDPIDGTKGFLRGDQYAVALALVEDGQVVVAVLGCPNLIDGGSPALGGEGSLVFAERGKGTWTTPLDGPEERKRLRVSSVESPAEARLLRSFESGHTNTDQMSILASILGAQAAPVLMDSQAKYAVLAAGSGDLLFRLLSPKQMDYREKIWDQAAGALVVEEAGGRITDLDGKPLDFSKGRQLEENRGVLASNGQLHEAALEALRKQSA